MPADTIYGLSARALDEDAVNRVRAVKERSSHKPFIVLISDEHQIDELGLKRPEGFEKAAKHWPGPLSIILDAPNTPEFLHCGTYSLAVRLPDEKQLLDLIRRTGPIISTSANPEGKEPAHSYKEARDYFGESLDFYVDAGETRDAKSSTLVRVSGGQVEVIRQGAVTIK